MAGKSRQERRRQAGQAKKRKDFAGQSLAAVQRPADAPAEEKVQAEASVSPLSAPVPAKKTEVARHSYVRGELRRIGILAGILVIILVVLSLALP